MTSINTNVAAMTALQTLQQTNMAMDNTQNRISTGLRVAEAKDNAAYWSIATGMRSDNQAMSAVSDSLGIGAATVDTAYTGLAAAKDVLNEIKAKLTTATSDGVDRSKVQSEITALQEQLKTISDSASFSGQNWLSNTAATTQKEIVSSLSRDASGKLAVGSIKVDIVSIRLFAANAGILDKTIDIDQFEAATGTSTVETTAVDFANTDDKISFSISQNGAAGRTVEITQATLTAAGLAGTSIKSDGDLKAVYAQALQDAGIQGIDVSITAGALSFKSLESFTVSAATSSGASGLAVADLGLAATDTAAAATGTFSTAVKDIDISVAGVTSGQVQAYIRVVDEALSQVTTAASSLGAVQNRVEMQTNFVSKLMDTIDKGVGALVDADMTEESTRLKALQTQQQLGVQALSIANTSTQAILQLFQG
ncbi:flagellin [Aurantimonas sp. C2-6-R+9]|uniref:flagellin N-terminal helical domain-containing protein n=1 Tax=unclassified Aurantimonas TaxID=2638230 RepID=UPI002E1828B0|nr:MULTISPECIES: flagellin [unclassified Aurantimonas]MEC5291020.1 flagellin [Aurantimonas sp. C2-3-R2]MEC5381349.1 flagellin [Aurantimonas sp. C2-6-R+9]MEC5412171.1 flagellin [Aurantimonas sp. C2-4-R8]